MGVDFQARIKVLLAERGLTQADLHRATKLERSLISNYCTGKVKPTLDNAQAIAEALGVTLDELTGFKRQQLTEQEEKLLSMFRELGENERRDIVDYTEFKHAKKFLQEQSSNGAG